ncbi:Aste57867_11529 [Aphanomyces stellatus]|uniref:Aste57867_11529 protein n=1 Tax=Aphanomyces stellatus TaxID=120398 RepID=A0A485KTT4_9STRA|nr:hypothetical protein As57867_011486 [Aphanomyces stellatus]VFT88390.1 Aste57867_11529 [Aphanomyces stellatus]
MEEILQSPYYKAMIASKTDMTLPSSSREAIDDIQTYCHELKCRKKAASFVECLQEQFVFEMLLGVLENLLLEPSKPVIPPSSPQEQNPEMTPAVKYVAESPPPPAAAGLNAAAPSDKTLWKPFYLEENQGSRSKKARKMIAASKCDTELATRILQLWLALVDLCSKMNVSAVYFDEVKAHILDPRFSLIFERWLFEPSLEHIEQHKDLCSALVALIIYLHNHAYFDATCFLRPVTQCSLPIQTCLSSFFHVIASLPKDHATAQHFSQWCMEIKFVRPDAPPPQPIGVYQTIMEPLKFDSTSYGDAFFKCVKTKHPTLSTVVLPGSMRRLNQELVALPENLPVHEDSMIAVRVDDDHPHHLCVLITGPRQTPYDSGCFQFRLVVPGNYPQCPPAVQFMTTGQGTVRFSPNLYECGKVCLSILGTWQGDPWNPVTSTILQVLVSIQGAILGAEFPYYNEPGRERQWGTPQGIRAERTAENGGLEPIRLGTVSFAWSLPMEHPPKGFETLVREHFWLKRMHLVETMALWLTDGRISDTLGFYTDLRHRIMGCLDVLTPLVAARATGDELADFTRAVDDLKTRFPAATAVVNAPRRA